MVGDQKFTLRPLYLQVRDLVLQRITSGTWKPGTMLPAETDLARELGISSGTVRKALDALEAEHVVSRRQGKGTFVNDSTTEELVGRYDNIRDRNSRRLEGVLADSSMATGQANATEQERLRLDAGDDVIRIQRVRVSNDRPYMHEEVTLPARLFPGLASREQAPPRIVELAQEFGLVLGRGVESLSVAAACTRIAARLSIAEGTPVLRLDRTVSAIDGRPVEWRVATCHLPEEHYLVELV